MGLSRTERMRLMTQTLRMSPQQAASLEAGNQVAMARTLVQKLGGVVPAGASVGGDLQRELARLSANQQRLSAKRHALPRVPNEKEAIAKAQAEINRLEGIQAGNERKLRESAALFENVDLLTPGDFDASNMHLLANQVGSNAVQDAVLRSTRSGQVNQSNLAQLMQAVNGYRDGLLLESRVMRDQYAELSEATGAGKAAMTGGAEYKKYAGGPGKWSATELVDRDMNSLVQRLEVGRRMAEAEQLNRERCRVVLINAGIANDVALTKKLKEIKGNPKKSRNVQLARNLQDCYELANKAKIHKAVLHGKDGAFDDVDTAFKAAYLTDDTGILTRNEKGELKVPQHVDLLPIVAVKVGDDIIPILTGQDTLTSKVAKDPNWAEAQRGTGYVGGRDTFRYKAATKPYNNTPGSMSDLKWADLGIDSVGGWAYLTSQARHMLQVRNHVQAQVLRALLENVSEGACKDKCTAENMKVVPTDITSKVNATDASLVDELKIDNSNVARRIACAYKWMVIYHKIYAMPLPCKKVRQSGGDQSIVAAALSKSGALDLVMGGEHCYLTAAGFDRAMQGLLVSKASFSAQTVKDVLSVTQGVGLVDEITCMLNLDGCDRRSVMARLLVDPDIEAAFNRFLQETEECFGIKCAEMDDPEHFTKADKRRWSNFQKAIAGAGTEWADFVTMFNLLELPSMGELLDMYGTPKGRYQKVASAKDIAIAAAGGPGTDGDVKVYNKLAEKVGATKVTGSDAVPNYDNIKTGGTWIPNTALTPDAQVPVHAELVARHKAVCTAKDLWGVPMGDALVRHAGQEDWESNTGNGTSTIGLKAGKGYSMFQPLRAGSAKDKHQVVSYAFAHAFCMATGDLVDFYKCIQGSGFLFAPDLEVRRQELYAEFLRGTCALDKGTCEQTPGCAWDPKAPDAQGPKKDGLKGRCLNPSYQRWSYQNAPEEGKVGTGLEMNVVGVFISKSGGTEMVGDKVIKVIGWDRSDADDLDKSDNALSRLTGMLEMLDGSGDQGQDMNDAARLSYANVLRMFCAALGAQPNADVRGDIYGFLEGKITNLQSIMGSMAAMCAGNSLLNGMKDGVEQLVTELLEKPGDTSDAISKAKTALSGGNLAVLWGGMGATMKTALWNVIEQASKTFAKHVNMVQCNYNEDACKKAAADGTCQWDQQAAQCYNPRRHAVSGSALARAGITGGFKMSYRPGVANSLGARLTPGAYSGAMTNPRTRKWTGGITEYEGLMGGSA